MPLSRPPIPTLTFMPAVRAGLLCANPNCVFLPHSESLFGGYYCKKCHWHISTKSKRKNKHGPQCEQREAPQGAPRAPPVPPQQPLSGAVASKSLVEEAAPMPPEHPSVGAGPTTPAEGENKLSRLLKIDDWDPVTGGIWDIPEPPPPPPTGLPTEPPPPPPGPPLATLTTPVSSPPPASFKGVCLGHYVTIAGFTGDTAVFNGLRARVVRKNRDGRFNLRLADGTELMWGKPMHFSVLRWEEC